MPTYGAFAEVKKANKRGQNIEKGSENDTPNARRSVNPHMPLSYTSPGMTNSEKKKKPAPRAIRFQSTYKPGVSVPRMYVSHHHSYIHTFIHCYCFAVNVSNFFVLVHWMI